MTNRSSCACGGEGVAIHRVGRCLVDIETNWSGACKAGTEYITLHLASLCIVEYDAPMIVCEFALPYSGDRSGSGTTSGLYAPMQPLETAWSAVLCGAGLTAWRYDGAMILDGIDRINRIDAAAAAHGVAIACAGVVEMASPYICTTRAPEGELVYRCGAAKVGIGAEFAAVDIAEVVDRNLGRAG